MVDLQSLRMINIQALNFHFNPFHKHLTEIPISEMQIEMCSPVQCNFSRHFVVYNIVTSQINRVSRKWVDLETAFIRKVKQRCAFYSYF